MDRCGSASTATSDGSDDVPLPPPTDVGELVAPAAPGGVGEGDLLAGESGVDRRLRGIVGGGSPARQTPGPVAGGAERGPAEAPTDPGTPARGQPDQAQSDNDTANDALIAQLLQAEFEAEAREAAESERRARESQGQRLPAQPAQPAPWRPPPVELPPQKPPRSRVASQEVIGGGAGQQPQSPTNQGSQPGQGGQARRPSPAWLAAQQPLPRPPTDVPPSNPLPAPPRPPPRDDLPDPPSPDRPSLLPPAPPSDPTVPPFLSLLRTPALAPLLPFLRSFLANFPNVPPERRPGEWHGYMARLRPQVASLEPFREDPERGMEGVEKLLLTKVYPLVFAPGPDREADSRLRKNLAKHAWVTPSRLEVRHDPAKSGHWDLAGRELARLEEYRAPRDKLTVLCNACRVVVLLLDPPSPARAAPNPGPASDGNASPVSVASSAFDSPLPSADSLLPALIALLVLHPPPALFSNLHYVQRYRHQPLTGEEGYILTSWAAAGEWAARMGARELRMAEAEWRAACGAEEGRRSAEARRSQEARRSTEGQREGGVAEALLRPLQWFGRLLDDGAGAGRSASFNAPGAAAPVGQPQGVQRSASQPPSSRAAAAAGGDEVPPWMRGLSEEERRRYEDFEGQMRWALEQSEREASEAEAVRRAAVEAARADGAGEAVKRGAAKVDLLTGDDGADGLPPPMGAIGVGVAAVAAGEDDDDEVPLARRKGTAGAAADGAAASADGGKGHENGADGGEGQENGTA
ncbi:hypothetical protein DFJ74DRAFT_747429 [Hyaloraphidium curvatum]|nr:hypothetical protein DFJ74DRAFT_747429 [Hyaloraphidium curvatum]